MPRPKGSKVVQCECGGRVVGMPGTRGTCSYCGTRYTIPKGTPKKTGIKKVVKQATKKVVKQATKKRVKKAKKINKKR